MASSDASFSGSIPALYDRCLGPLLFEPYAADMAARATALRPSRILETAAGSGIVTAALAEALPQAEIVATDLNQAMLDVAAARIQSPRISFQAADAQALPFDDRGFDLVVCQFGVMFFPDRIRGYREALRLLKPGGTFLFNVWNSLDSNPVSAAVAHGVAELFPDDPPSFLARTPFGYHDLRRVEADLRESGFRQIVAETVEMRSRAAAARDAALGLCAGSPLRSEIEARDPAKLEAAIEAATRALDPWTKGEALDAPMSAHVVSAAA